MSDQGGAEVLPVLRAKRDEVQAELEGLTQPTPDAGGISFGKRVGDGTSIAVERLTQVAAHDRLQVLLAEIDRAEAKVAEGTYGRCDNCGTPIAPARLEARPWSTHCVDCA
ncbi:MAG TPA: TraR/DksA family transcriptional regulator [Actinomycetes bacterium]|nr:TraR/DksA family transcriptional regulator [Actinomycetes bacterium]